MKTKKEIEECLEDCRKGLKSFEECGEEMKAEFIFQGWVEALEYVLGEGLN